jgi:ribosomal protein S3
MLLATMGGVNVHFLELHRGNPAKAIDAAYSSAALTFGPLGLAVGVVLGAIVMLWWARKQASAK